MVMGEYSPTCHFCHCMAYTLGTGLEFIVKGLPLTPHTEAFLVLTVSFNGLAALCGSPLMECFLCGSHSVILPRNMGLFLRSLPSVLQEELDMHLLKFHVLCAQFKN
ncbi:hypothetical protein QQF64_002712 [Cirrhinus molitorella]|uniref:Uncharacterized protein n=1 Tax=Cirrhinus molitorella TaxID=172907 RepID=A0ABR3MQZ4_9TELE